ERLIKSVSLKSLSAHLFVLGGNGVGESVVVIFKSEGSLVFSMVIDSCTAYIENSQVVLPIKILQKFQVSKLDCIVWTHPHDDHSQGMDEIVSRYYGKNSIGVIPKQLYGDDRNVVKLSECCKKVLKSFNHTFNKKKLKSMDCQENEVRKLMEITLVDYETGVEKQFSLNCLSPFAEKLDDKIRNNQLLSNSQLNELSLTLSLVFDDYCFYFGADAPESVIKQTNDKELRQSRWIKIPHHGSKSSEILTGMLNRKLDSAACTVYISQGLPNDEVLSRYYKRFIPELRWSCRVIRVRVA
ncbi:MAG: hypothetical protein IKS80_01985, partial [Bacteroidaceae bacterium]|nr:hypothetical protein [Bacteroidaceae bacterium]